MLYKEHSRGKGEAAVVEADEGEVELEGWVAGAAEVEASVHARVHEFSHGHLPKRDREKEEEEEEEESDLMIPCSSSCR
mgnify:CR=1 FL=1